MAKRRTSEQWQQLIQQQKQSGLTVAQFCRENHISESNFYLKLKKFREANSSLSTFVTARPAPSFGQDEPSGSTITLQHGQCRLQFSGDTSTEWLAALMKSLMKSLSWLIGNAELCCCTVNLSIFANPSTVSLPSSSRKWAVMCSADRCLCSATKNATNSRSFTGVCHEQKCKLLELYQRWE